MARRFGVLAALALVLIPAAVSQAADNPLDAVSTDAGGVVRIKALSATVEKLNALAKGIGPVAEQYVKGQLDGLGKLIRNEKLAGVNRDADWWMAFYPRPDESPVTVFIVPATDVKQMRQGLVEGMKFVEFGSYGVYTTDADTAEKTAARIKGEGRSIAGVIEKECTTLFDTGDIAAFVNVRRLATAYRDQIESHKDSLPFLLEVAAAGLGGGAGLDPRAGGMLRTLLDAVSQGIDDAQSFTLAAKVEKDGLYFEDLLRFAADSQADAFVRKSPPQKLTLLQTLPLGAHVYAVMHGDAATLAQFGPQALLGAEPADEKAREEVGKALAEIEKLKFGTVGTTFSIGNLEGGLTRSVVAAEVDNPARLRELTNKLLKAYGAVELAPGIKQSNEVVPDAEKFEEISADHIKSNVEATDDADPQVALILAARAQFMNGSEGALTRVAYLQDKMVQTSGGGKQAMQDALQALDKNDLAAGRQVFFQQVCERLGEQANVMVLLDVPGALARLSEIVNEAGVLPIGLDDAKLKEKLKPSLTGFSLATEPQGVRMRAYIPIEQAAGLEPFVQIYLELSKLLNIVNDGDQ